MIRNFSDLALRKIARDALKKEYGFTVKRLSDISLLEDGIGENLDLTFTTGGKDYTLTAPLYKFQDGFLVGDAKVDRIKFFRG